MHHFNVIWQYFDFNTNRQLIINRPSFTSQLLSLGGKKKPGAHQHSASSADGSDKLVSGAAFTPNQVIGRAKEGARKRVGSTTRRGVKVGMCVYYLV
jgi:hypothetical protein